MKQTNQEPKLVHLLTLASISGVFIAGMIFTNYHRKYTLDFLIVTASISAVYIFITFRRAYQRAREVTRKAG